MTHTRRQWLRAAAALSATATVGAFAQAPGTYPERPIRLVVPYGPAGGPDVLARLLGQQLSAALGQSVVVENRPGANGSVAAQAVARSAPDGYTLLVADTGHLAINPALYAKLPYDPERDFTPVTLATWTPFFLVVNSARVPATTFPAFLELARSRPGQLSYGSSGNGSPHHLATEVLKAEARIDLLHVPYKGVAESVPALLGGQTDAMFVALPSVAAAIESGKVRVLAVSSARRSSLMPQVPTVAESGLPGFDMVSRIGLLAPADTPAERVARVQSAALQSLRNPELSSRFATLGMEVIGGTAAEYRDLIRADRPRYQKLVQQVGLRID